MDWAANEGRKDGPRGLGSVERLWNLGCPLQHDRGLLTRTVGSVGNFGCADTIEDQGFPAGPHAVGGILHGSDGPSAAADA